MYSTSVSVYGCISVKGICKWKWKLKCVDVYMACWKCKRLNPITIKLIEGVMWHTDRLWGTSGTQVSLIDSCVCYAAQYTHNCSYTVCPQHSTSGHTHSMSGLTHPMSGQTLVYPQRKVPFSLFHMYIIVWLTTSMTVDWARKESEALLGQAYIGLQGDWQHSVMYTLPYTPLLYFDKCHNNIAHHSWATCTLYAIC